MLFTAFVQSDYWSSCRLLIGSNKSLSDFSHQQGVSTHRPLAQWMFLVLFFTPFGVNSTVKISEDEIINPAGLATMPCPVKVAKITLQSPFWCLMQAPTTALDLAMLSCDWLIGWLHTKTAWADVKVFLMKYSRQYFYKQQSRRGVEETGVNKYMYIALQ